MKSKVLNLRIIGIALLLCFAASSVWAQGGSGRITPTSRGTTKTTTTKKTTTKKPVVKQTVTKRTTTVRKPVGTTKTFEYYFSQGSAALDKEDYQSAITHFTSAIRLNARSADAYYNRGLAYLNTENYEAAIDDYTKSIQYKPAADAYNNRGLAYEYNGNYKLAADDYRTALRLQPGYALAKSNLERVESQYDLGGNYSDMAGDGSYANRNANSNNNSNTNDSEYYAELADEYYDKNDFTNALINYNKAIQLNPNGAGSYVRRGFIYHYTGEVSKAYEDYETAVRLSPALKNEAYIRCMIYDSSVKAEISGGIRDCTATINEFPGFSLAYYKRGVGYYSSENYSLALQDFTKSIEIRSNFFNSMVYRGLIYSATDRPSLAVAEYTRAIQIIGVNDAKAYLSYNNRGAAYEALGNYTQAAADYRKSLQLNPNFTTARDNLDKVLKRQKGAF
jgi:tetratricopeptide (TPR) repeat protein